MANFKRRKPRSQVRCGMCTDARKADGKSGAIRWPRKAKKFWPAIEVE